MNWNSRASASAFVVLLCAFVLLFLSLMNSKSIWSDEGYRLMLVDGSRTYGQHQAAGGWADWDAVLDAVAPQIYQPLYYLYANALLRITGAESDTILRLGNLPFFIASIFGLLRIFRFWPDVPRLFLIIAFTLNGYLLMHFLQIREFPLFLCLGIWSTAIFLELWETEEPLTLRRQWKRVVIYGLLVAASFYANSFNAFFVGAQILFAVARRTRRLRFLGLACASYSLALVCALPWLITAFFRHSGKYIHNIYDRREPTWDILSDMGMRGIRAVLTYRNRPDWPILDWYAALLILAVVAALIFFRRRSDRMTNVRLAFGLTTMAMFGLFQVWHFYFIQPTSLWSRYFIVHYFGYTVIVSTAFCWFYEWTQGSRRRLARGAWLWAFLVFSAAGIAQVQRFREYPYGDTGLRRGCEWDDIAARMARYVRPGDTVIYRHRMDLWTIAFYYHVESKDVYFGDLLAGRFPLEKSLWALETGVDAEYPQRLTRTLKSNGYSEPRSINLGCRCRMLKYTRE